MSIKRYSELKKLKTLRERYEYLKLTGRVGEETFGHDRFLNQMLYKSKRWIEARDKVLIRDNGNDMGLEGYEIKGTMIIHHMNPVTSQDLLEEKDWVYDPEYLITVSERTHSAIHYSTEDLLPKDPIIRTKNDTCLWKKKNNKNRR